MVGESARTLRARRSAGSAGGAVTGQASSKRLLWSEFILALLFVAIGLWVATPRLLLQFSRESSSHLVTRITNTTAQTLSGLTLSIADSHVSIPPIAPNSSTVVRVDAPSSAGLRLVEESGRGYTILDATDGVYGDLTIHVSSRTATGELTGDIVAGALSFRGGSWLSVGGVWLLRPDKR